MNRALTLQARQCEILTEAADRLTDLLMGRERVESLASWVEDIRGDTPQEDTQSHRILSEIRDGFEELRHRAE